MKYVTTIGEKEFIVDVIDDRHVELNGSVYQVDFDSIGGQPVFSMLVDGRSYEAYIYPADEDWQVLLYGRLYPASVEDERERRLRQSSGGRIADRGEFQLKAPMPGLVVSIPVSEGQQVQEGDVLLVLESMKMQNELKCPRSGVVTRTRVVVGDRVEQRQVLLSVA